jgi:hypothetical protein
MPAMRYRKLDAAGDFVFGHNGADYHQNSPETVSQAVLTRLKLHRGEWFLDSSEGTPYTPAILGKHTAGSHDFALRARVLETEGVKEITEFESHTDPEIRKLLVSMTINTDYGQAVIQEIM